MEALSTELSHPGCDSPPLSPFNLMQINHVHSLPPLKSLPTWNRTHFNVKKPLRSIPKNNKFGVELVGTIDHAETCTQTSPPSSGSSSSKKSCHERTHSISRMMQVHERKIKFLQSNHEHILSNLHKEVDMLKNENKALQFRLIMVDGDDIGYKNPMNQKVYMNTISKQNTKFQAKDIKVDYAQFVQMQHEIKDLRKELNEAKLNNNNLINLLEEKKTKSSSARNKAKFNSMKTTLTHFDHISMKQSKQLNKNIAATEQDVNNRTQFSVEGTINELKQLTSTQESELLELKKKLDSFEDSNKKFLPKLNYRSRSARVNTKSATRNRVDLNSQIPREHTSLPILQPFPPNNNLSLRRKRAQALHIQRQRSNKDVTLINEK